jgi:two-component system response regulator RegX3
MATSNILIITDHFDLAKTWIPGLGQMGVKVSVVSCSKLPDLENNKQQRYDMIIIDTYTANFDFVALSRTIREKYEKTLLLLTYERDERLHLLLYQAGVAEVIVKPIGLPLFHAKVAVWLQRADEGEADLTFGHQLRTGPFMLDTVRRSLSINGRNAMRLSSLECSLLALLIRHEGHVLETETIIDRVWTNNLMGDESLLKNLIYRLRRKIEPDPTIPRYIQTVKGQGYLFQAEHHRGYGNDVTVDVTVAGKIATNNDPSATSETEFETEFETYLQ